MKKLTALMLSMAAYICLSLFNTGVSAYIPQVCAQEYTQAESLHILVSSKDEADAVRNRIMQGKSQQEILNNFKREAAKYSKCPSGRNGGYLGSYKRGVMVPEFENAAFNLPEGEVSEPVQTAFGWHLIYNVSRR